MNNPAQGYRLFNLIKSIFVFVFLDVITEPSRISAQTQESLSNKSRKGGKWKVMEVIFSEALRKSTIKLTT